MRFTPVLVSAPSRIPDSSPPETPHFPVPRIPVKLRYGDRRGYVRGHLREDMDRELRELTEDEAAGMYWTLEDYVESVVLQRGYKLVGWPPDVPFQNLSNIRGGFPVLTRLEHLWASGVLKFTPVTEDERLAASLNAEHLAPAPKCAHRKHPGGREDIGRARYCYKTNPYNRPRRRPKTGPKTPKYVPDEWDD